MRIGVPRESRPGERLVAATPKTVAQLHKLGYEVVVEAGAGAAASFPDVAYAEAGATVVDAQQVWDSDVVTTVNPPADAQIAALRPGSTLVSMLAPASHPELLTTLAERSVSALALDPHLLHRKKPFGIERRPHIGQGACTPRHDERVLRGFAFPGPAHAYTRSCEVKGCCGWRLASVMGCRVEEVALSF